MHECQIPWYVLRSPEVGKPFQEFFAACQKTGVLEGNIPHLLRIAAACAIPCPRHLENRIRDALDAGVSKEEITETLLIAAVENDLEARFESEIESRLIGEMVMERLRTLDHVAYVRFASVYRNFQDLEEFEDELRELSVRRARAAANENQAELPL